MNTKQVVVTSLLTAFVTVLVIGLFVLVAFWRHQDAVVTYLAESVATGISEERVTQETRDDLGTALTQQSRVVQAVEESSPAVVSVIATREVPVVKRYYERSPGFFNMPIPRYRQEGTQEQQVGGGSGFLVSSDGFVVTNRHVVSDTDASYSVLMKDGSEKEAEVVARDSVLDIAVLDIEGDGYPYLSFGNSDELKPGQKVIAIGNALGEFTNSVSTGVISGLSRSITAGGMQGRPETLRGVIQTDAAINPGNSGGPLLDLSGEVIGVNVAMARGSENIGFALPANEVDSIVQSVKETGEIARPFLGVRYVPVTNEVTEQFDLSVDHGALLIGGPREGLAVVPDSPADEAGLQEGDVITAIEDEQVTENNQLASVIRSFDIGQTVSIEIMRSGEIMTVNATLTNSNDL